MLQFVNTLNSYFGYTPRWFRGALQICLEFADVSFVGIFVFVLTEDEEVVLLPMRTPASLGQVDDATQERIRRSSYKALGQMRKPYFDFEQKLRTGAQKMCRMRRRRLANDAMFGDFLDQLRTAISNGWSMREFIEDTATLSWRGGKPPEGTSGRMTIFL